MQRKLLQDIFDNRNVAQLPRMNHVDHRSPGYAMVMHVSVLADTST